MKEFVIIVAGGTGSRMKSDVPKQFLVVNKLPVLMHTINAFIRYSASLEIILVLPETQFSYWKELCSKYQFEENYRLVQGGETRFQSVKNGLEIIQEETALVAVHDGVRPIISTIIIANGFAIAKEKGNAVTSVPLKDSIRVVTQTGQNIAKDRIKYRLIQTPQTYRIDWMRKAFSANYQPYFTDCASVVESAGYEIHLIDGSYENIKITTPEDLEWARIYLKL